ESFTPQNVTTPGGDLARICGLKRDLTEPQIQLGNPALTARQGDGSPLVFDRTDVMGQELFSTRAPAGSIPAAIILRDSFGELLIPFLSEHFARATWSWTYGFPQDLIEREHPDVVIQEMAERKLMVVTPE